MAQRLASISLTSLLLALAGCGSTPATPPGNDAGPDGWSAPDAYVVPDSCDMDHVHSVDGMAGGTVSMDFDTTMSSTRPRDLGLGCGNTADDIRWAPQEVIALHVPGTGLQGVAFTTDTPTTTGQFNTLIQVRQGDCRAVPTQSFPPTCFDDISGTNFHAAGGLTVMGGSTIYLILTGYSHPPAGEMAVDEGNVHVDITITPNTAPNLTAGTALFSMADTLLTMTATDAEGPIAGFSFRLYNAMGGLDTNGDGTFSDADAFILPFDSVDRMAPMYTGHVTLSGTNPAPDGRLYQIAAVCRQAGVMCTQMGLTVFDQQYATSNELMVDIHEAATVGVGATCDISHLCATGLTCTTGACVVQPAAMAECTAAMEFALTAPTGTMPTMSYVTGSVGSGAGVFVASCAPTPGREQIWHLTIPTGDFDLRLTTDVTGTAMGADTVLSLRSVCADQTTELAMGCNDDVNTQGGNYHSLLNFAHIPSGEYWAFVEAYGGGGATPYTLQATLTPH